MPKDFFQTFLRASSSTAHLEVSRQGVVVNANAAFARFASVPLDQLIGTPIARVLASGHSERFEAWLNGASVDDGGVRINFSNWRGSPFSLHCLVRRHPEGLTVVGEAEADDDRQVVDELMRLNNELSTLAAEVFVFVSHLTVLPEDHESVERHFRQRQRLVDDFPGFLHLQLLRPETGEATHTFVTTWEDREAFRRYMQSKEHALSHSREPAEIMARTRVRHEAYEVLMDSRRPEG